MTKFRINLIKGHVPDYRQRRRLYWGMHAYILLTGILLVIVCHRAADDVMTSLQVIEDAHAIKSQFRREQGKSVRMEEHLHGISQDLERKIGDMERLGATMNGRILLSPILSGIALSLEHDMKLARFELEDTSHNFEFDIACLDTNAATEVDSSVLIDAWQTDPVIMEAVQYITPALIQKQLLGSSGAVMLKFTGTARKGAP